MHTLFYIRPRAYREIHHIYLEFEFIIIIVVISRTFHFMGRGDFILYKNSERYFEVRPYYLLKIILLSTLIWPYYLKYSMQRYISFSRHSALNLMTSPLSRIMHLIPKWRRIDYSFVCMLISPLCLVYKCKKQENFEVKMRQRGLINMQTKE